MKEKIITASFLLFYCLTGFAQTTKTYKFELEPDLHYFSQKDKYFHIEIWDLDAYGMYKPNTPAMVFRDVEIVLPEQEKVKNVSFMAENCTYITDVVLPPNNYSVAPMNDNNDTEEIPYEIKDYPFKFKFKESEYCGHRTIIVSFNLFAYNAITKTLSWPEHYSITVETESMEQWEYVSWAMPDGRIRYLILNPEAYWEEKKIPSIVGSVWSYVYNKTADNGDEGDGFFRYTVLDEPKAMNGHTYYPMVKYTTCEYSPSEEEQRVYLREEGCRIYKYLEQEEKETLLYNFAIQPYDQDLEKQHNFFKTVNGKNLLVTKHDKCITAEDGFPFRRMVINDKMTWIDGIGNIQDFLAEYDTEVQPSSILNYYRSGDGKVVYKNAITDYRADECAIQGAGNTKTTEFSQEALLYAQGNTLLCTAPNAVKLEVYTMDAVKVGEARFNNGTATVTVNQIPATYLYIVTYPDGRRESGKVRNTLN